MLKTPNLDLLNFWIALLAFIAAITLRNVIVENLLLLQVLYIHKYLDLQSFG